LYDELTISHSINPSNVEYRTAAGSPLNFGRDTVSQALEALSQGGVEVPPLHVVVTKQIPFGSGMGGGSSNAGIIMRYLYERFAPMTEDTKSHEVLTQMALKVGADVPFFLTKGPALVWGVGERTKAVKMEPFAILVAVPTFSVSSKEAYEWFDKESTLTRRDEDATTGMIEGVGGGSSSLTLQDILKIMHNDLEKSVGSRHPEIGILKKALRDSGALGSLMSGSGSSVYGVFKGLSEATVAREKLQHNFPSNYAFFACETLV
jgi:4-diphosphocytidyl-2-C-methyl-D-erythritol kinase